MRPRTKWCCLPTVRRVSGRSTWHPRGVQALGYDAQQRRRRKGFWEKPAAGQGRVTGADFGSETAHENDPQLRFRPLKSPGQVGPGAATRNQHVGQEQVDLFAKLLPRFE